MMKRIVSILLAFLLLCSAFSAFAINLGKGSTSPYVLYVQDILVEQKFMEANRATGTFNDATTIALKKAQNYMGIPETGKIDDRTLSKISHFAAIVNCKQYVSLRKTPSRSADVIVKLGPDHHKVFVLEFYYNGTDFHKVKWQDKTGYILADYLLCYEEYQ